MDNSNITKCKLFFSLDKELAFINKMNKEGWKLVYIKGRVIYSFEKCESSSISSAVAFTPLKKQSRTSILPSFTPRQRKRFWSCLLLRLSAAISRYRIQWTALATCCILQAKRLRSRPNLFVKRPKKPTVRKGYINAFGF